jgi:hypothetical protein
MFPKNVSNHLGNVSDSRRGEGTSADKTPKKGKTWSFSPGRPPMIFGTTPNLDATKKPNTRFGFLNESYGEVT